MLDWTDTEAIERYARGPILDELKEIVRNWEEDDFFEVSDVLDTIKRIISEYPKG